MKLYKVSKEIADRINKADEKESPTAMSIYFEIMNRATYVSGDMSNQPRFVTAIGALLDGKANCQGYSDAFYMLGRIGGTANGGLHEWNTITYEDGKTYFIDVTAGDDAIQKMMAEKNLHIFTSTECGLQILLQRNWSVNLARTTNADAGINLVAKKLAEGSKWFSVMTPLEEKYFTNSQDVANYISNQSGKNIYLNTRKYGKYMFFTAHLR